MREPGKQNENKTALSKPETKKQVSQLVAVPGKRRRANWTYLELIGLALAFFLLIWPAISFTAGVIAPNSTQAATPFVDLISKSASPGTVSPGGAINFTFTAQTRADAAGKPTFITFNDNVPGDGNCTSLVSSTFVPISNNLPSGPGGSFAITLQVTSTTPVLLNVVVACTAPTAPATYTNILSIDAVNTDGQTFGLPTGSANFTVSGSATTTSATTTAATTTAATTTAATTTAATTTSATTTAATTTAATTTAGTTTAGTTTAGTTTAGTTTAGTTTAATTTSIVQTPVPPVPTQTPVPGAPTNTPTTSSGSSTTNPSPTNTPTPTTVPSALSPGAPATTTTSAAAATSVAPSGTGVIAGSVINKAGSVAGAPIDLIWAKVSGEQIVATAVIDSSGQFFFGGVGSTGPGEAYYLRFRNSDPGGTTLRSFIVKSFSFTSGSITRVDNIDVTDVSIGAPGAAGQTITPPFTFDWFNRGAGDSYSLTFFDANGQVALDTGNLGGATSFVLPSGRLANGQYSVQVNVANDKGTGTSNKRFSFGIGVAGAAITTAPAITTTTAPRPATTAPSGSGTTQANSNPVTTRTSIPGSTTSGNATTTAGSGAATTTSGTATTSVTAAAGTGPSPTPLVGGGANVPVGGELIGVQALPDGVASTTPISRPATGGNSLPSSGGELPIAGLALAAFTLIGRRVRLVRQTRG